MEFLPRTMGTRPRVAVEVRPEGVVAARGETGSGLVTAVSRTELSAGALEPGLRVGNVRDRSEVVGALRRVLDGVSGKGAERSKYVTLIVPDTAVRVLLLDFDALPGKPEEALGVVRFRLKKLLPFDAEHAVLSYQVMGSGRDVIRVLAVAMPCDVLSEYERLVTEAGYLPGAVLPSTLATLAGLGGAEEGGAPALVVNAGPGSVTTAIVQGGVLLLHRTVDMGGSASGNDGYAGDQAAAVNEPERQGLNPADFDRMDAETEMQSQVLRREAVPIVMSEANEAVQVLNRTEPVSAGREITQAVSVAAAYYEDTVGSVPTALLSAGTLGAERMGAVLEMYGMEGLRVREIVDASALGVGASTTTAPRGWLAGVWGALKS